jgi:hypothetical protein
VCAVAARLVAAGRDAGPEQPIPFSHRVHAYYKKIDCFFCHPYADRSPRAGMPPVEKCMLCHSAIITNFPPIKKLRGYYDRKEPIQWVRVTANPDFVFFPHHVHLAKGIDCGECHGNVREMDRVKLTHRFTMGYCVDCHKARKASRDCWTCHR